eukprot:scaffold5219_cov289-Prasinococcus_capsulatus_cf.AAC.1
MGFSLSPTTHMKRVQKVLEVGARLVHRVRAAKLVVAAAHAPHQHAMSNEPSAHNTTNVCKLQAQLQLQSQLQRALQREEGRHRRQHLLVRLKEGALVVRGRALGVGVVAQQQRG